jgi:hypothetical protein
MSRLRIKTLVAVAAVGAVLAGLLVLLWSGRSPDPEPKASRSAESPPPVVESERRRAPRPSAPDRTASPRTEAPSAERRERERLRGALLHRYGRSSPLPDQPELDAEPVLPPASWSSLPEDYVRGILEDQLMPLAEACYEDLGSAEPEATVTLSLAVVGDAELGGVIDSIEVNAAESSTEGELSECLRQAAYELRFDPPDQGQGVEELEFTVDFSAQDRTTAERPR